MKCVRALALASCVLAGAHPVSAQQSIDYASVSGRVIDPSGAVIPGAQVTARHTQTNVTGATVTDQDGRFRFPYLRVGPYEITVQPAGIPGRDAPPDADGGRRVRAAGVARRRLAWTRASP